jgi:acetyltransferase-like isoleucine patch superfamily enzyme
MSTYSIYSAKQWLKTSRHPLARRGFGIIRWLRLFELPAPRGLYRPMYELHRAISGFFSGLCRILYWTPMFKSRCAHSGKHLYLFGGMPYLSGQLRISHGDNCRISGQTTFSGRGASRNTPELIIGDNVDIGWMGTIAVAGKVRIGNNVRIAGRVFIAGYPGHPMDAADRAAGMPDLEHQTGDVVIEDDAWIATGVTILPGVHIGKRSVIATGSVVTSDIPADVIAGGNPARVIKSLVGRES